MWYASQKYTFILKYSVLKHFGCVRQATLGPDCPGMPLAPSAPGRPCENIKHNDTLRNCKIQAVGVLYLAQPSVLILHHAYPSARLSSGARGSQRATWSLKQIGFVVNSQVLP